MNERITELFCYAVIGEDGIEGVPAVKSQLGPLPLMGADTTRMLSFKRFAELVEKNTGKPVRLYRFSQKEEIDWKNAPSK